MGARGVASTISTGDVLFASTDSTVACQHSTLQTCIGTQARPRPFASLAQLLSPNRHPRTFSNRAVMMAERSFLGATATSAGTWPPSSPSAAAKPRAAGGAAAPASNQQKCSGWSARPSATARSTPSCLACPGWRCGCKMDR